VSDKSQNLQHEIVQASENNTRVNIRSGGSKSFLGVTQEAQTLDVQHHSGVISYEPTELVITARSGTPLSALNATLSEKGQWLAFESPAHWPDLQDLTSAAHAITFLAVAS